MSKKPSAFGAFATQQPRQSQDEIAEAAKSTPTKPPRKRAAPVPTAIPADRKQKMVRLVPADDDRLKEFNLSPYNMTFQQLVITALNYYLEHKMGQKGRPLQTPTSYK